MILFSDVSLCLSKAAACRASVRVMPDRVGPREDFEGLKRLGELQERRTWRKASVGSSGGHSRGLGSTASGSPCFKRISPVVFRFANLSVTHQGLRSVASSTRTPRPL